MDLSTTYLGLKLPHPFMPGASPLADDLDTVRRLEDAGAAAIVMRSLFEEQIVGEELAAFSATAPHEHAFGEATTFLPEPAAFVFGPDEYLEQLARIKGAVHIPVIASLNGTTPGGWLHHAALMAEAGADALELNLYALGTDPTHTAEWVEARAVEVVKSVKSVVRIPVAVKLSPFYTSLAHFAARLDAAGADGLVLFNRFYQPDIDLEALNVARRLDLSTPAELLLRLRWLAQLSGHVRASLAASGGVHGAQDALKAVMTGAHAVQMVSVLLHHGPGHLRKVRDEVAAWLEEHEYESLAQARGSLDMKSCPDPAAYERGNYMRILQSWKRVV